jgi:Domain of unknown function (DUF6249)
MIWPFSMSANMVFWIVIGVVAVASSYFYYRASVSRDRTIQTLAEKGQPIPPELLSRRYLADRRYLFRSRSPLRTGIRLLFIGIIIFLIMVGPAFWFENGAMHVGYGTGQRWPVVIAAVPFLMGVVYLLIGLLDRRPPPPPPAN